MNTLITKFSFLIFLFAAPMVLAQGMLTKHSIFLEGEAGISFYNKDLRYLNGPVYGYDMNDALRFTLIPKVNYAIDDNVFISGHLGFNLSNYKRQTDGFRLQAFNLKTGGSIKAYFLELTDFLYLYTELGLSLNFYSLKQWTQPFEKNTNTIVSSNLDVGLTVFTGPEWMISVIFKDVLSYHSGTPNFEHKKGFNSGSPIKDFIRFPHFSFAYKLK